MRNIEIKSPVENAASIRASIERLPATFKGVLIQRDTYFEVPHGRLKLREIDGQQAELIAYVRGEEGKERVSDFEIHRLDDPASLITVLTKTLGVRAVVEKRRELFMFGDTRIHLDDVKGLGSYLEFEIPYIEGGEAHANQILAFLKEKLVLDASDFINGSYIDLLLAGSKG